MRGNELLYKMELIDPAYIEAADAEPRKKRNAWFKWAAAAACLCVAAGAAFAMLPRDSQTPPEPAPMEFVLSDETTAKVSYGYDEEAFGRIDYELVWFTEEEMFARDYMFVFRGRVSELTNITIDYNGMKDVCCIAEVAVDKVYQGDIRAGDKINMLLHCPIGVDGIWVEDTDVITHLECGMEGIFMPFVYDGDSRCEMNGAVLMYRDIADCGLGDGERWAFLSKGESLIFAEWAYPGAKNAETLDDVEEYVVEMLKKVS